MKKTFIILGLGLLTTLFSCESKESTVKELNPLKFSTNFDNLQGWDKSYNFFQKEHSVSGIWGSSISEKNPFSYEFKTYFQSIPSSNIKAVKYSAFVKKKGFNESTGVCLDIRNEYNESLNWQTFNFNDTVKVENEFVKIEKVFDIEKINKENALIKLFIWNSKADSTSFLYIDDIEIEFLEK